MGLATESGVEMSESICGDCRYFNPITPKIYDCMHNFVGGIWSGQRSECIGFALKFLQADHQESSNGAALTAIEGDLPTTRPTRESCLSAAREAVVGGREVAYGSPEDNFARIARLWAAFLHNKTGQEIAVNETDVALMLDLVKTARLQHNPGHVDSWVDKAGYSACGCEIGGRA